MLGVLGVLDVIGVIDVVDVIGAVMRSVSTYYISKTFSDIPFQIIFPAVFISIVFWMLSKSTLGVLRLLDLATATTACAKGLAPPQAGDVIAEVARARQCQSCSCMRTLCVHMFSCFSAHTSKPLCITTPFY